MIPKTIAIIPPFTVVLALSIIPEALILNIPATINKTKTINNTPPTNPNGTPLSNLIRQWIQAKKYNCN